MHAAAQPSLGDSECSTRNMHDCLCTVGLLVAINTVSAMNPFPIVHVVVSLAYCESRCSIVGHYCLFFFLLQRIRVLGACDQQFDGCLASNLMGKQDEILVSLNANRYANYPYIYGTTGFSLGWFLSPVPLNWSLSSLQGGHSIQISGSVFLFLTVFCQEFI